MRGEISALDEIDLWSISPYVSTGYGITQRSTAAGMLVAKPESTLRAGNVLEPWLVAVRDRASARRSHVEGRGSVACAATG